MIIIGFLLILVGAPPVILLSLALLVFLAAVEVTVRAVRRQNETERAELHLRPALEAYRPEFIVYFASTVGANYQVGMWLPYFVRIGRPFIIVTRTAPMLAQIGRLCEEYGVYGSADLPPNPAQYRGDHRRLDGGGVLCQ